MLNCQTFTKELKLLGEKMLDIKLIRKDPKLVGKNLERRDDKEKVKLLEDLLECDKNWREQIAKLNELRKKFIS